MTISRKKYNIDKLENTIQFIKQYEKCIVDKSNENIEELFNIMKRCGHTKWISGNETYFIDYMVKESISNYLQIDNHTTRKYLSALYVDMRNYLNGYHSIIIDNLLHEYNRNILKMISEKEN